MRRYKVLADDRSDGYFRMITCDGGTKVLMMIGSW